MRRLFSTFAGGGPGAGLALLRLAAGGAAVAVGLGRLRTGSPGGAAVPDAVAIAAGLFLIAGLWTPIAASLVGVQGMWSAVSRSGDPMAQILLGAIGCALALLGPGAWSVDARLFGWRRIDVGYRKDRTRP